MARKVVNRRELREQAEAAEAAEQAAPKKKAAKKKTTTRRKKAADAEVRKKLYWGVFSQSLKQVATFEFHEKKEAEKKAEDLSKGGKSPHFIRKVKEVIEE